ncbi:MAG TPA: glycoside hydrolase family 97 N-terminal domain-containing protein [Bacteroidales bacterium]|nr:glycoside hydrolase family 97 N-terminal domain-containing protein [Bacteroidales bacterium]HPE55767.1 glycoside hydrolase family 97 N-terminal domain-containing protein [Bacteroidales bacterium]
MMASCKHSKVDFETIIPSPGQELRLYIAVNQGLIYYLIKKQDIVVGWSNLYASDQAVDSALLWKHFSTDTKPGIQKKLPKQIQETIYGENPHNEAEIGFKTNSEDNFTFYLQFIVSDNGIAFRFKLPETAGNNALAYTEIVLHKDLAPWKMDMETSSNDEKPFVITAGLPVTFISGKSAKLNIFEVPAGNDTIIHDFNDTEDQKYFFTSEDFTMQDDFLYSSWRVLKIVE